MNEGYSSDSAPLDPRFTTVPPQGQLIPQGQTQPGQPPVAPQGQSLSSQHQAVHLPRPQGAPVQTPEQPKAQSLMQPVYPERAHSHVSQSHESYREPTLPRRGTGKGLAFLVGLLGVLVGSALSVGILYVATSGFSFSGSVDTDSIVIDTTDTNMELPEAVATKVTPSVVNIDVYASSGGSSVLDDFLGDDGSSSAEEQTGLGSGVILTSDGYILTNYHVVEGADRFMVSLENEELEATLVGSDPSSDLAVIKVAAQGLTPIEIGDSDAVDVGEWIMAVGSPFGLEKSVSTGIVSALYRSTAMQSQAGLAIYANLIQTDAAINPGNSGGALVNSSGQLIGINTLINSTTGSSAGVGFAIPSNHAYAIAEQIMRGEEVKHPFLGISLYSVNASTAEELKVQVQSGAYIESVQPGSPAESAGLRAGDVITSLGNKNIKSSAELIIEIRGYEIGETVTLGVNRNGQALAVDVVLGSTTSSG